MWILLMQEYPKQYYPSLRLKMKSNKNKSEKICCEYIKDGECTLNEREKADCCPKNGLYTKSEVDKMTQVDEIIAEECNNLYGELIRENIRLKAKLKENDDEASKNPEN